MYPRIDVAVDSLHWTLARNSMVGGRAGANFYFYKQAGFPRGGIPALNVIYSVTDEAVILHSVKVG